MRLTWAFVVERATGIEPALSAWENPSGKQGFGFRARSPDRE
jgi:hypothetical protein